MTTALGILLSGSGTTYENLQHAIDAGQVPAHIAVVISSKPVCGGNERARRFGHPLVIARESAAVTAALKAYGATWVIMCGWLRYWDPPALYQGRTLNIHPALLPAYGGPGMYGHHVHAAVLAAGESISGCTVHQVAGAYDSGPILAQETVPVLPTDSPEQLASRVQTAERALYPRIIAECLTAEQGRAEPTPGSGLTR